MKGFNRGFTKNRSWSADLIFEAPDIRPILEGIFSGGTSEKVLFVGFENELINISFRSYVRSLGMPWEDKGSPV